MVSRLFKTYIPFTKGVMQTYAAYQMNFYLYVLGDALQISVLIYIWFAVFSSSSNEIIQGFTFMEIIGYVIMSNLTGVLISNEAHWEIGQDVRTGNIAMNLIKPVNYQIRQYFMSLGGLMMNFIFLFLPIWLIYSTYSYFFMDLKLDPIRIVLYLFSAYFSSLILFFINFLFGLAAFFVEYIFGFIFAKEAVLRLLSGQLIPLSFFPTGILAVFKFLPFAGMIYTPVMIYMGKYTINETFSNMTIQLVWIVILFIITQFLWKKAIKRLTILGG
jgi:ABC-2 type transport system permease protein